MNYVFDSSFLIYFGKLKILEHLQFVEGKKYISKEVYREVVEKGIERKEEEAKYIADVVFKKILEVAVPKSLVTDTPSLTLADREVISLSLETKSVAIIDDEYARSVAEKQGIMCHGSVYMLLEFLNKKILTKKEALDYLDTLISLGFYLSVSTYQKIVRLVEKL